MRGFFLGCAMALGFAMPGAALDLTIKPVEYSDLLGWQEDNHSEALTTFLNSCALARGNDFVNEESWEPVCKIAKTAPDAKRFFEAMFQPILIKEDQEALFTGYFEPQINGSLTKAPGFETPIYGLPDDLVSGQNYFTRGEIMNGAISGRGLEIAWLENPVDAFFLQIQGSGRIKLQNGNSVRVGYAGFNGYKYRSIGKELVRRGTFEAHQVSAPTIRKWVKENPEAGRELLAFNPSYVFFRRIPTLNKTDGPIGAMTISVTAMRSLAVDPIFVPLGAPVWMDKRGRDPMQRLMIAQDVGSAIKGAQRADIFYGTGAHAGRIAGQTKASGRIYVLLPNADALKLIGER